jgi:hypothetical protein
VRENRTHVRCGDWKQSRGHVTTVKRPQGKGETFAGFGVGTATACRYVTETVALVAAAP